MQCSKIISLLQRMADDEEAHIRLCRDITRALDDGQ
jgi:hypothetical protein